jgi:hypothetical protein
MSPASKFFSFDMWFRAVDAIVLAKAGVSVNDLPDCCFIDWFDDGMKPAAAAARALKSADF